MCKTCTTVKSSLFCCSVERQCVCCAGTVNYHSCYYHIEMVSPISTFNELYEGVFHTGFWTIKLLPFFNNPILQYSKEKGLQLKMTFLYEAQLTGVVLNCHSRSNRNARLKWFGMWRLSLLIIHAAVSCKGLDGAIGSSVTFYVYTLWNVRLH